MLRLLLAKLYVMSLIPAALFAGEKQQPQPNIILILADDLGYNGLGCYGNQWIETPNIDKLAEQGMRFTQGYAAAPTSAPSRAALMSGQYAPRTDVYRVVDRFEGQEEYLKYIPPEDPHKLRLEKTTIAEALKPAGYSTAMYGKWHLGYASKYHPLNQGFDEAIESHGAHFDFQTHPPVDHPKDAYVADFLTDTAMRFIENSVNRGDPFFLYMPYFLIHKPLEAKQEFLDHFKKKLPEEMPEEYPYLMAMTKTLDENVGRMMNKLVELGIDQNTFVIFASDNGGIPDRFGPNLFNQPLREYKGETFEGGIRVPYIFRWPGKIQPGTTSDEPIHGIDLYPTCLDAAGAEQPENYKLDGLSLMPCLTSDGSARLDRQALYWYYPKYARYKKNTDSWVHIWRNVVRTREYKLIEYIDDHRYELFHISDDISESENLVEEQPEKADELIWKLDVWKERVDAPRPIPNINRKLPKMDR